MAGCCLLETGIRKKLTCCSSRFVEHIPETQSPSVFFFFFHRRPFQPQLAQIFHVCDSLSAGSGVVSDGEISHIAWPHQEMAWGCGQRASTTRYLEMVDSDGSRVQPWGPSDTGLIPACDFSTSLARDRPPGPQFLDWTSFVCLYFDELT